MILSGTTIRELGIITPHVQRSKCGGMSYGESFCGYDIRIAHPVILWPLITRLTASVERFRMPSDVVGMVTDKSTWARRGVQVQNTIIEPGWHGWLTIELTYSPISIWRPRMVIPSGSPIAQVMFSRIDRQTSGYDGKYQNQPARPVEAILER